ncbi:MAG: DUF697 domain-containing protein [Methylomonas sp.]|nr:DUF697 domain-containing protein [Methylomonas sp.]PPD20347.1 MAG: hypothetical protein CTY23_09225 [Methylomonas sp.]PPD26636.1 MAG: hypothetical protein CTY22_04600 [Methylomonas sp.]PPD38424.1 MAG: hypothetical protein CTY21_04600 [Methylomonas sp.]PPD40448.1 MAG: hypothetical protein CTY17_06455 [Methylomonas sp.]
MSSRWIEQILHPSVPEGRLHETLEQSRQGLQVPVFWLLGKTQSGKTSIIQALTGSSRAEVGEGFRPCTLRSVIFEFPSAETAFVRFLDTRGLGEAGYDPTEDIAWCCGQAHLLMVVIKAMDHQLDAVLSAIRQIRDTRPEWPLLVVQTCLHEGYPGKTTEHIQPYPYSDDRHASLCPPDLLRSLRVQREQFKGLNARFVAIDFTQEGDGYSPAYYGFDALWTAIEAELPLGLQQMLLQNAEQVGQLNDVYVRHARPYVIGYALSAGALAITPVPTLGLPLVIAAQGQMFRSIASIYGLPLTRRSVYEVFSAVGIGGLSIGFGARELAKLVPGWGAVVSGLSTAAITYALGMTLCFYYAKTRQGAAFTPAMLKAVYKEHLQQGRELLKQRFK